MEKSKVLAIMEPKIETVGDMFALLEKAKVYNVEVHFGRADVGFQVGKELLETLSEAEVSDEARSRVDAVKKVLHDAPIVMGIDKKCHSIDVNMRKILRDHSVGHTHLVPENRLESLMRAFEEKKAEWDKAVEEICLNYETECQNLENVLREFFDIYAPSQTDTVLKKFRASILELNRFKSRFYMELEMGDIPDNLTIFSEDCQKTLRDVKQASLERQCTDILHGILEIIQSATNEWYTLFAKRCLSEGRTMTTQSVDKLLAAVHKSISDNVFVDQRLLDISENLRTLATIEKPGLMFSRTTDILLDVYCYSQDMNIELSWEKSVVPVEDLYAMREDLL